MQGISIFVVFIFTLSCTMALHIQLDAQWRLWKEIHNKQYSRVEELLRYALLQNSNPDENTKFLVVLYGKTIGRRLTSTIAKLILVIIHIGSE